MLGSNREIEKPGDSAKVQPLPSVDYRESGELDTSGLPSKGSTHAPVIAVTELASVAVIEKDMRDLAQRAAQAEASEKEAQSRHEKEVRKLLLAILDIHDAFDRVFENIEGRKDLVAGKGAIWMENFRTIVRMLRQVLATHGVAELRNYDHGFDPHWHRAAELIADPARLNGEIVEVLRTGYVWNGQLLREAEVRVVQNH